MNLAVKREAALAAKYAVFEATYKAELDAVFERLHNAANTGAYHMSLKPGDFLHRADVKAYMQMKGFEYHVGNYGYSVEITWSHATDELK